MFRCNVLARFMQSSEMHEVAGRPQRKISGRFSGSAGAPQESLGRLSGEMTGLLEPVDAVDWD